MDLRPARETDVDDLLALRTLMFEDMGVVTLDERWRQPWRAWFASALRNPDVLILVVDEGGSVLGSGMAELAHGAPGPASPSGRTAHLSNLVVYPAFRERGHGRRVLSALLEWAHQVADRAELRASEHGIDMYRRFGFELAPNPAMRLNMPGPAV